MDVVWKNDADGGKRHYHISGAASARTAALTLPFLRTHPSHAVALRNAASLNAVATDISVARCFLPSVFHSAS